MTKRDAMVESRRLREIMKGDGWRADPQGAAGTRGSWKSGVSRAGGLWTVKAVRFAGRTLGYVGTVGPVDGIWINTYPVCGDPNEAARKVLGFFRAKLKAFRLAAEALGVDQEGKGDV